MPDIARVIFPRVLQAYMQRFSVNQADIAKRLGVSKQIVSDWVHGKKFPNISKMQDIADIFGVYASDMINPDSLESLNVINESSITPDEMKLLMLYRGANDQAKSDAVDLLSKHQKKDMSSKAE